MSLKTATLIAIIGVGAGMIIFMLYPYLARMIYSNEAFTHEQRSFFVNALSFLGSLFQNGSLILFLVVLFNRQK